MRFNCRWWWVKLLRYKIILTDIRILTAFAWLNFLFMKLIGYSNENVLISSLFILSTVILFCTYLVWALFFYRNLEPVFETTYKFLVFATFYFIMVAMFVMLNILLALESGLVSFLELPFLLLFIFSFVLLIGYSSVLITSAEKQTGIHSYGIFITFLQLYFVPLTMFSLYRRVYAVRNK